MKIKCDYCGSYINDTDERCSNCGAVNNHLQRNSNEAPKTIEELKLLEPFGDSNKEPLFVYKNLKIDSIRALTEGKHLKLTLRDINYRINAIGFNLGYLVDEYRIGDKIDLVGTIEINSFNGIESIQLNIKDIMKSF